MFLPLACLKGIFLKLYKNWVSLCSIIRVKSSNPCWSGQYKDICPSIKKSMIRLNPFYAIFSAVFLSSQTLLAARWPRPWDNVGPWKGQSWTGWTVRKCLRNRIVLFLWPEVYCNRKSPKTLWPTLSQGWTRFAAGSDWELLFAPINVAIFVICIHTVTA